MLQYNAGIHVLDCTVSVAHANQNHHHMGDKVKKSFKGPVLGYVTPWNGHGLVIHNYLMNK